MALNMTVAKMIDSALMRCGKATSASNPEFVIRAKEALQFCLLDLLNRVVPIFIYKHAIKE